MPDFIQMDPELIAEFWIYFIGSFVCGFLLGILVAKIFFRREKAILAQEKQSLEQEKSNWSEKLEKFEEMKQCLKDKSEELDGLKEEISNVDKYWEARRHTKQEALGHRALYDMFHQNQKK